MLGSDIFFYFDEQKACIAFLLKCFQFSRPIQSSVRKITAGVSSVLTIDPFEDYHPSRRSLRSSSCQAPQLDSLISFTEGLLENTAGRMTNRTEFHFLFYQNRIVHYLFHVEHKFLYPENPYTSLNYLFGIWKHYRNAVKARRHYYLTKCGTFESIRSAFAHAVTQRRDILAFRDTFT